jgi:hypothetical protein
LNSVKEMPKYPGCSSKCVTCNDHFQLLRPNIREVVVSKRFERDAPGFDVQTIIDCEHLYFKRLHKFEETFKGNHIFRALQKNLEVVYAIDKNNRLIFLRGFDNFASYKRFLGNKKGILSLIESC